MSQSETDNLLRDRISNSTNIPVGRQYVVTSNAQNFVPYKHKNKNGPMVQITLSAIGVLLKLIQSIVCIPHLI